MNIKSLSRIFKKYSQSPIWFWIICFLTGVFIYTSFNFLSTANDVDMGKSFISQTAIGLVFSLIPVYEVIVMSRMSKQVVKHLSEFRPALDLPDSEYKNLLAKVLSATISSKYLWFLIVTILLSNTFILFYFRDLPFEIVGIYFLFIIVPSFFMLYSMSRILWLIYKLQYFPLKVNILDTKPLLTLSKLTQRFALYLLPITTFFGWFNVNLILFMINNRDTQPVSLLEKIILAPLLSLGPLLLILSVCVFVLPVLWVRYLIVERKSQALSNIAQKLSISFHEHDKMIETGDLSNINTMTTSINALTSRAETYKKISELPWEMQTLREFLGAVILPIILWVTQYYLGRFLGK